MGIEHCQGQGICHKLVLQVAVTDREQSEHCKTNPIDWIQPVMITGPITSDMLEVRQ